VLKIMLVRPWKSEEDKCSIPHRTSKKAAVLLHRLPHAQMELSQDSHVILRVHSGRKLARPNQIAKDSGERSALDCRRRLV
jgi:hypothetical protein